MKKILFLIVCFLPFVVACTQENKIKNDLTELELKDKVKSLRIINYEPIDKFGEITAGERLEGNRSYSFNKQGFILSFETFGKDGEIKTSQKIIYNEQNKKSEIRTLNIVDLGDTKINFESKSVYKYNSEGNNVEILTFARDKETAKEEYQYNLKNEKIEELEKLDLKLEDMEDRENFDFGDMKTFFCEEEDIRNIFQNEELENNINFLSKNNQLELGDLKNIKLKDVLVVVVLIGIYVFLNGMIPLGKQAEKNNNLKKQVKSLESEYLKEKNEKLPDYSEELSKLNEIDNGIKRKEYYSFIKFLVDNSVNGIDYTKVKYENKKWLIQGEIENFDNFEKFESSVRKKYENSELGYIKDNDETTVFEYTVSEKE